MPDGRRVRDATASLRAQSEATKTVRRSHRWHVQRHASFDGEVPLSNLAREFACPRRTELRPKPCASIGRVARPERACTRAATKERAITPIGSANQCPPGRTAAIIPAPPAHAVASLRLMQHSYGAMTHHQYSSHNAPPCRSLGDGRQICSVSSCGLISSGSRSTCYGNTRRCRRASGVTVR